MSPPYPIDYERVVREVYEAILSPGDIAIDVGAHMGQHTFPMAQRVGFEGRVYAVEPLPTCEQYLQNQLGTSHKSLVDVVTIIPAAMSETPGTSDFVVAEDLLSFSGLKSVPYPEDTRTETITVDVETIDTMFSNLPSLAYMKIDAEGAELHILRGAVECLSQYRPVVAFEFGTMSNQEYGVEPLDMYQFWESQDYVLYAITGERLDSKSFLQRAHQRDIWDYVAVPIEGKKRQRIVESVLRRARVNWLAVRAELKHANDHADVGTQVPPLRRFRGPLWPIAWGVVWLFLQIAKVITIPQRLWNHASLNALNCLVDDLERVEKESLEKDRRIRELESRMEVLEKRCEELEPRRNPWLEFS